MDFRLICNDETVCPRNWGIEKESAVFHRIYFVLGGEAYCSYEGKQIQLLPGTLYIFPVMSPYTLRHNPAYPFHVLWFHAELKEPLCNHLTAIKLNENDAVYHLLLAAKALSGHPEYYQNLTDCVGNLLDVLKTRVVNVAAENAEMNRILEFIEKNIDAHDLCVEALAKKAGMDRASFSRKFRKIYRISPGKLIFEKRMKSASQALCSGATVSEAAERAGYSDEKSFSRAFKRYTASTPSEYRKKRNTVP